MDAPAVPQGMRDMGFVVVILALLGFIVVGRYFIPDLAKAGPDATSAHMGRALR